MNFTNKQKLYFNVILLFIFTYLLTSKIMKGFKTQDYDYIRIGLNAVIIAFTIKSIIKYNTEE